MLPIPDIQRLKPSLHGIGFVDQSDGLINAYSSIESHPAIRVTNQCPSVSSLRRVVKLREAPQTE